MRYTRTAKDEFDDPRWTIVSMGIPASYFDRVGAIGIFFGYETKENLYGALTHPQKIFRGMNYQDYFKHFSKVLGKSFRVLLSSEDFVPVLSSVIDTATKRTSSRLDIRLVPEKLARKTNRDVISFISHYDWKTVENAVATGDKKSIILDVIDPNSTFFDDARLYLELWKESFPISSSS